MKKNIGKIAGLALAASILMTGCAAQHVPSENDNTKASHSTIATASAKASESAIPSTVRKANDKAFDQSAPATDAKPESTKFSQADIDARKGLGTPNTINIDEAFKSYGDKSIEKSFPKSKFNTKAGAKFGLSVMNDLIQVGNFYQKRDATKDFELINTDDFTSRMTGDFIQGMKADIAKDKHFNYIPTATSDGAHGYTKKTDTSKKEKLTIADFPTSSYNTPAVWADDDLLVVSGERTITWHTVEGKVAVEKINYWVSVTPSGDSWLVEGMGWERLDSKVSDAK